MGRFPSLTLQVRSEFPRSAPTRIVNAKKEGGFEMKPPSTQLTIRFDSDRA